MSKRGFTILILFILLSLNAFLAYAGAIPDTREGWDHLWAEVLIDIVVLGVLFAVVAVYLLIRFKRKSPDDTGSASKLSPLAAFGWVVIPVSVFMADDIFLALKNFDLWSHYRNVPKGAYELEVESYMWGYNIKYPEGIITNNELRVPVGRPIHVKLSSPDVIHTLFIPDLRVKWDALPGRQTYLWFYPREAGEHVMTCTEYCGTLHSGMHGKVIMMPQQEFSKWIDTTMAEQGIKPKGVSGSDVTPEAAKKETGGGA